MPRRAPVLTAVVAVLVATVAAPAQAVPSDPQPVGPGDPAAAAADALVGVGSGAGLETGAGEALTRTGVVAGTRGLRYVTYARTFRGLPVVGGDVVVTTGARGGVRSTAARTARINVGTTPSITADRAARTARARLSVVESVGAPKLVVLAGDRPALAWEVEVAGRTGQQSPSRLRVFVDARTGAIARSVERVRAAHGESYYNGAVAIDTEPTRMVDPKRPGLQCYNRYAEEPWSGADDTWGNGQGTDLETACVDAMYGAQREIDMIKEWLGRDGIRGDGTSPPVRIGLDIPDAFWEGDYAIFGVSADETRQATAMDVVAHELGHAIFEFTPGGDQSESEDFEGSGINEATGDIFGALTEAYADNPNDPPDYIAGEEVDLLGTGPVRYMYDPSLKQHPNCWSTAIPRTRPHAGAGPLNHWFYLAAEGSAPAGQPASPTCDGSEVTGVGLRTAGEIFYNALLQKTTGWRYANVRVATLHAARDLYPGSCSAFDAIRKAWDAVSVPAQPGEPGCSTSDFTLSLAPAAISTPIGGTGTSTVTAGLRSGDPQELTLAAAGLPEGVTATFSPATVATGGTSELTLTAGDAARSGRYQATVVATGTVSRSVPLTVTVTGASGGTACTAEVTPDAPIEAGSTVESTAELVDCARPAGTTAEVSVEIDHPTGDAFRIGLYAPDGSEYLLQRSAGESGPFGRRTYQVDLSSEPANGVWTLEVADRYGETDGRLVSWTLRA